MSFSSSSMLSALRIVTRDTPKEVAKFSSVGIGFSTGHSPSLTRWRSTV